MSLFCRRLFVFGLTVLTICFAGSVPAASCCAEGEVGDVARWVEPLTGTAGTGHCSPAAAYPFGMVQPGADTGRAGWNYCSGYYYPDTEIVGFSQTHLNGTGSTDLGDLSLFPFTGARPSRLASRFSHQEEVAEPGYYSVVLADSGVRVEATCSERVAYYRFRANGPIGVVLDLGSVMNGGSNDPQTQTTSLNWNFDSPQQLSGRVNKRGWIAREIHFVIAFDRPVTRDGEDVVRTPDAELGVRVAISASSSAGAKRNLAAEGAAWNFDAVRRSARAAWNAHLDRLAIPKTTPDALKRNLYTALYRVCLQPNLLSDVGDPALYTTFSLWDTFRAAHPLYTLLYPEKVPLFVDSLLEQGNRTGYLPVWPLWGRETDWMIGTHSIPVIVDAYLKGLWPGSFTTRTPEEAFSQIADTLTNRHGRAKVDWALLDRFGYYPCDVIRGEGVSRLLEGSFDDWCAARMAERLGKRTESAFFDRRAAMWTNVFDRTIGFMRGRRTDGGWREPYDPRAVGHNTDTDNDFTEGNGYQWTWHVLQDPVGLIAALGGAEAAEKRLDELFAADSTLAGEGCKLDVTGLIGQYAHGNEPSHHIPYLYALCGRPDKTERIVRMIMERFYKPTPDGLAGNDDCGQMSAWYVLSALGCYPVTPCGTPPVCVKPAIPGVRVREPVGQKEL